MQVKHGSHQTRVSVDASSYDEVCVLCGATDIAGAGWGDLAKPCKKNASFGNAKPKSKKYTSLSLAIKAENFLQAHDLNALRRFYDTCDDNQGYDLAADHLTRLQDLGCLKRHGISEYYSITSFGLYVIGKGSCGYCLPLKTSNEKN